jgi:hypothetical protein
MDRTPEREYLGIWPELGKKLGFWTTMKVEKIVQENRVTSFPDVFQLPFHLA